MNRLKVPRIYHLPWSKKLSTDDKYIQNNNMFLNKHVVILVKYDGECLLSSTKILMGDGTHSSIGQIVKNNRIGEYVLGVDLNNQIVRTKITNVFYHGTTEEWLSVNVKGNKSKYQSIKCTKDHKFYTDKGYIEAQKLTQHDHVYIEESYISLTDLQKQVILGKLLGDGSLHYAKSNVNVDKASMQFSHKTEHREYLEYTNYLLGNISSNNTNTYTSGFGSNMLKAYTATLYDIYDTFSCLKYSSKKEFSKEILQLASPITLALWYMDDGTLISNNKQRDRCNISTCGFNYNTCNNLVNMLLRFGIKSSIKIYKGYNYIFINADNTELFFDLISSYIPPCMQYKLSSKYKNKFDINNLPFDVNLKGEQKRRLRRVNIYSIEPYLHNTLRGKYDIETETHNFFADGVLVHNSTSLYSDGTFHARSLDSKSHPSRDWLHQWWSSRVYTDEYKELLVKYPNLRLVGENMYAVHTIEYNNLPDLFILHSAWNGLTCLSWADTEDIARRLNIEYAAVLYRGLYVESILHLYDDLECYDEDIIEGYIVRCGASYDYMDSNNNIAKYVSSNFIIDPNKGHWFTETIRRNRLKQYE